MSIGEFNLKSPCELCPWENLLNPCRLCPLVFVLAAWLSGCAFQQAELPDSSFNSVASATSQRYKDQPARKLLSIEDALVGEAQASLPALSDSLGQGVSEIMALPEYAALSTPAAIATWPVENPAPSGKEKPLVLAREPIPTFSIEAIDAPIEAILFSLAADASVQLKVHGSLLGRVSLYAQAIPLPDILASLASQVPFSWQLDNAVLNVWGGERYSFSYTVDYLNISRRTQSSVGLATQVGTINASDSTGSLANSSQTRVENTSDHQFWNSLLSDIQNMMSHTENAQTDEQDQFSINKEAGLLTLYALPEVHRNIQRYLQMVHNNTQRQVLIEATVVEVALSDSFDTGVDWQLLAKGINGVNAAQVLVGAPVLNAQSADRLSAPSGLVSFVHEGGDGDVRATLSLLEQFGDVRILSRPRIIALNNQSSVLKVVDNKVYFTVNVQRRRGEDDDDEIVTETQIHTVPVGLVMNVTPQISQAGFVMLNVRPTLSRILGFVNDPNPELALANVSNGVPEIQVRELESMLQVKSGDVAIIGGLMQETQAHNDTRLPGLGVLPGIGRLFSRKSRERRQTELLIVLRPTVIQNANSGLIQ